MPVEPSSKALPANATGSKAELDRMRSLSAEEISDEISDRLEQRAGPSGQTEALLLALLENPRIQPAHLVLLLERRDLGTAILERIAASKQWIRETSVCRGVVSNPQTPLRIALKLARDFAPLDLVTISLRPSVRADVRRLADDLLLSRLQQLPLGQRLMLARRGPGRVAAELVGARDARIPRAALDNPYLTEAHLLRSLANETLPADALDIIAGHAKWSRLPTVRNALLRHPHAPLDKLLPLLTLLSQTDLNRLAATPELRPQLRRALRDTLEARARGQLLLDTPESHT